MKKVSKRKDSILTSQSFINVNESRFMRFYKRADQFGSSFNFKLPGDQDKLKTTRGATVSLFLLGFLLFYGCLKVYLLQTKKDTEYLTYEIDTFYIREIFTQDDGFNVAYALTEYDAVETPIDDPQYGTLRSYHYGWGQNGRGSWSKELKTEYCTDEELHLTDSSEDSKMFQIHELSINDVRYYRQKFQCI